MPCFRWSYRLVLGLLALAWSLAACTGGPAETAGDGALRVVATTTIIGDVVRQVAGDQAEVTVLIPPDVDPHSFEPRPQDAATLAEADVVFLNGLGLEALVEPMLANVGDEAHVVPLSANVETIEVGAGGEAGDENDHGQADPHVWTDPHNVMVWVDGIEAALIAVDPTHADSYRANADAYRSELQALDAWITDQVATIPEARRQLVTDHVNLGYLAHRYGFDLVGAVSGGASTTEEPSAQQLAALEDKIAALDVPAIFVGTTVNPTLARVVAEDTGIALYPLYTDSLSGADGPAATYVDYMRYNVTTLVEALR